MSHLHSTRAARVAVSLALAGTGLAAALPATAAAKKSKPLTKAQVISLIKKYSKPGPAGQPGAAGKQGATGPAGTYTVGQGLTQTGNTLGVDAGAGLDFISNKLTLAPQQCPDDQYSFGVDSKGGLECGYAPAISSGSGTFNGVSGRTDLGTGTAPSATSIASATLGGTGSENSYVFLATANVFNVSGSTANIACSLVDSTTSVVIETQDVSLPEAALTSIPLLWNLAGLSAGDKIELQCATDASNATGVSAQGALVVFPND